MSGTLALASAIAAMDRTSLEALVARRRPASPATVLDPIGLAADLLRPESIARALARRDRESLAVLLAPECASDAERLESLTMLGLIGLEDGRAVVLPEVSSVLKATLADAGLAVTDLAVTTPDAVADREAGTGPRADAAAAVTSEDRAGRSAPEDAWYAAGLTATAEAAECLRALRDRPLRLNRSGTISVASMRALAESMRIDFGSVSRTLTALGRASFTTPAPTEPALLLTPAAQHWLELGHPERWVALATATLRAMPEELRLTLRADGDDEHLARAAAALPRRFPLLPASEFEAAVEFAADAEHLGLSVDGRLSSVAQQLAAHEEAPTRLDSLVAGRFPAVVPGVYLQPDLSVVVPGPLAPLDEAQLAELTVPEHVGVASTRRVTEASLTAALDRGTTPDDARAIFARLSLTGMPQPLEYLLSALAERLGSIIVEEHHGDQGRTRIVLAGRELADTLMVDRSLQHVQLHREAAASARDSHVAEVALYSKLRIDHVMAALTDARYPAVLRSALHTPSGRAPAPPQRASAGAAETAPAPLPDALHALVERVYAAARAEPGAEGFTRRLELAIRDRTSVRVTAESRGQRHTFTLLPVSVSNGRLRASDETAGVERTLPVSMITAVDPL